MAKNILEKSIARLSDANDRLETNLIKLKEALQVLNTVIRTKSSHVPKNEFQFSVNTKNVVDFEIDDRGNRLTATFNGYDFVYDHNDKNTSIRQFITNNDVEEIAKGLGVPDELLRDASKANLGEVLIVSDYLEDIEAWFDELEAEGFVFPSGKLADDYEEIHLDDYLEWDTDRSHPIVQALYMLRLHPEV